MRCPKESPKSKVGALSIAHAIFKSADYTLVISQRVVAAVAMVATSATMVTVVTVVSYYSCICFCKEYQRCLLNYLKFW